MATAHPAGSCREGGTDAGAGLRRSQGSSAAPCLRDGASAPRTRFLVFFQPGGGSPCIRCSCLQQPGRCLRARNSPDPTPPQPCSAGGSPHADVSLLGDCCRHSKRSPKLTSFEGQPCPSPRSAPQPPARAAPALRTPGAGPTDEHQGLPLEGRQPHHLLVGNHIQLVKNWSR